MSLYKRSAPRPPTPEELEVAARTDPNYLLLLRRIDDWHTLQRMVKFEIEEALSLARCEFRWAMCKAELLALKNLFGK